MPSPDPDTSRTVTARIAGSLAGRAEIILALAVADGPERREESVSLTVDGHEVPLTTVSGPHGTRLHHHRDVPGGRVEVRYSASVIPEEPAAGPQHDVERDLDRFTYLRPSRYCQTDVLFPFAIAQFGGLEGFELVDAVESWVHDSLSYVAGSSRPTDGATDTFLSRAGVCRDYAHLVTALLRARDIPARLASVYAPGLSPMDFHAVVEAWVDGAWYVVDATRLAPRRSMVRIATGRDATDTAFMTVQRGDFRLSQLAVTAVAHPDPDPESHGDRVSLA
jgi:transglutaminase-like putative cysteine protease